MKRNRNETPTHRLLNPNFLLNSIIDRKKKVLHTRTRGKGHFWGNTVNNAEN